jgi:hypothetical protein
MDYAFNILDTDLAGLKQEAQQRDFLSPQFFELAEQIQKTLHGILSILDTDEHLYIKDRYIKVKGPATKVEKNIVVKFYDTTNKRVSILDMPGLEYYERFQPIFSRFSANERPQGEFLLDRFAKAVGWPTLRQAIEDIDKIRWLS